MVIKKNLKKKIVFISGSSTGIGYGIAKKFLQSGFQVIINSNNKKKLANAAKTLNDCHYFVADITNETSIKKMVKKIKNKFKKIDFLICNYGNSNFKKNNDNFENALKHNFFSSVYTIRNFLPLLKKNQSKIVCISSICGTEIINGAPIGYSVAKSALNSFVKAYSIKTASLGISLNAISPGNILFPGSVWDKKKNKKLLSVKKYIKDNVPVNSFGSINDIFSMCFYLFSQSSNYITGSSFIIDGGQLRKF